MAFRIASFVAWQRAHPGPNTSMLIMVALLDGMLSAKAAGFPVYERMNVPANQPQIVPSTMIGETYTTAFLAPNARPMASQLGRLRPRPVSSRAGAGPFPMPRP